jgi:hypothetical protein
MFHNMRTGTINRPVNDSWQSLGGVCIGVIKNVCEKRSHLDDSHFLTGAQISCPSRRLIGVMAEKNASTVPHNLGAVLSEFCFVVPARPLVYGIKLMGSLAKVGNTVVAWVAVDVVDKIDRPSAVMVKPNDAVHVIVLTKQMNDEVSVPSGIPNNISVAVCGAAILPLQDSGFVVIREKVSHLL